MRTSLTLSILAFVAATAATAATAPQTSKVTLLVQFEMAPTALAYESLQAELGRIMDGAGLTFEFRDLRARDTAETYEDLVMVKFRGRCVMEHSFPIYDERGPLAWTHTAEGSVLPFTEVQCDKVRKSVRSALWGGEHARSEALYGKALARVLAHELYHIFGGTCGHSHDGIAKESLSGHQLISENLRFDEKALRAIRRGF